MKTLSLVFCFIVTLFPLISKELPVEYEYLGTDYNGIALSDSIILCYGNHGIITYSTDNGNLWNRLNVGNNLNIKSIINYKDNFWGIANNSIITSFDKGKTWKTHFSFGKAISSLAVKDNIAYLLVEDALIIVDMDKPTMIIPEFFLRTEELGSYDQIVTFGDKLILRGMGSIGIIDIQEKILEKEMPLSTAPFNFDETLPVSVKNINNKLYLIGINNSTLSTYILKSEDAINWEIIFKNAYILNSSALNEINNETCLLSHEKIEAPYYRTAFITTDGQKTYYSYDNIYPRYAFATKTQIVELCKKSEDTLIAAGQNNFISMSTDGGKSWALKSYFNPIVLNIYGFYKTSVGSFIDDSVFHILTETSKNMFTTKNGGTLWQPNFYSDRVKINFKNLMYKFEKGYKGIISFTSKNPGDSNIARTINNGKTYDYAGKNENDLAKPINNEPIVLNDKYLFLKRTTTGNPQSEKYKISRYDRNFAFIDSVEVPVKLILDGIKIDDKTMLIFCFNSSGSKADTSNNLYYKYLFMETTNGGDSWDTLDLQIPFYLKLFGRNYENVMHRTYLIDNKIYFPSSNNTYSYDISSKTFDSLNIAVSGLTPTMFKLDSIYYISSEGNIYFKKDISDKLMPFDSVDLKSTFYFEDENIYGAHHQDKYLYLFSASRPQFPSLESKLNIIRVKNMTSVGIIEKLKAPAKYLWASPPYPNPSNSVIYNDIYWGNDIFAESASFSIFDLAGNKLDLKHSFEVTGNNSGLLKSDVSNLRKGVYIIIANISDKQIPIRFTVE